MSSKQQRRAEVIGKVSAGAISTGQAANLLGLSPRHARRIAKAFEEEGFPSLIHGNAGRIPKNKMDGGIAGKIIGMASDGGTYHGLNTCHLHDMLIEREGISIGRSTLDRLLVDKKVIARGTRKQRPRRMRRLESPSEGMMLQIDGSPHDWLCGRGPKNTLIGAVDDATGKLVHAVFRPTEDLAGYIMLLRHIARDYGLPEALYHDKHTILRSPKEATIEDELAGREPQSQFQRIMSELGITSIPADSPQAKGRIERLWGTLQDRLTKEMSMEKISTISEANAFLPDFIARYNKKFARLPRNAESSWVEMEAETDIDYYFSARETRVVRKDHTIGWQGKTLQILPGESVLTGLKISVHSTPEGEVLLYNEKRRLSYRWVAARPPKESPQPRKAQPIPDKNRRASSARKTVWMYGPIAA